MKLKHLFLLFLVIVTWGFNFLVIKTGLKEIPPIFLAFLRMLLTSMPFIFFVKPPAIPMSKVFLYGMFMFALPFSLLFMGFYTGFAPGLASLVMQMQTFFTILLAILFLKERLNRWQTAAIVLAFSGIALAGANTCGNFPLSGFGLLLLAAFFWGIGNLIAKKIGKEVNMISLVVWGSFFTLPFLFLLSLFVEGPQRIFSSLETLSFSSLASLLYIAYGSTLFGYGTWSWLLSRYRLPIVAPFTLLIPMIAIVSSALLLGEPLQLWKASASFLVISGLIFNLISSIYSEQPAPQKED